jgi:hypothetical protein
MGRTSLLRDLRIASQSSDRSMWVQWRCCFFPNNNITINVSIRILAPSMKLARLPPNRNTLPSKKTPHLTPPVLTHGPHTRLLSHVVPEMPLATHALPERMWKEFVVLRLIHRCQKWMVQCTPGCYPASGLGLHESFEQVEGGLNIRRVRIGGCGVLTKMQATGRARG